MNDFSDFEFCTGLAQSLAGVSKSEQIANLETLLRELTAYNTADPAILHYRPYLAAANYLEHCPCPQITSANGVTYSTNEEQIESLKQYQKFLDTHLGLVIPHGEEAIGPGSPSRADYYEASSLEIAVVA